MRAERSLDREERAGLARRVLGTSCLRGKLDFLLEQKCPGWKGEAIRHRLAAYLLLEERAPLEQSAAWCGLSAEALSPLLSEPVWPSEPIESLAARRSLPRILAKLWLDELGPEEADRLAEATNLPGPITVRANLLKNTREELARALAAEGIESRPGKLAPEALHLLGRPNIFGSRAWREGRFEVQDEGSQLVALACGARPGERVIDFCAGAGGKTLALAAQMENRGSILALDVAGEKLQAMAPRLRRAGVRIASAHRLEPEGPLPPFAGDADLVLVDAPCTSLGTLRRGPDARWRLDEEEWESLPARQLRILERALECVRPGGRLVYATCTLRRAENEAVAERFAQEHPRLEPLDPPVPLGQSPVFHISGRRALKLLPHLHGTDGFFVAAWRYR